MAQIDRIAVVSFNVVDKKLYITLSGEVEREEVQIFHQPIKNEPLLPLFIKLKQIVNRKVHNSENA